MPGRLLLAQPGEALALPLDVVGERRRRIEVEGQPAVARVAGEEQAALDQQRLVAGRVPGRGHDHHRAVAEEVVLAVEHLTVVAEVEVVGVEHAVAPRAARGRRRPTRPAAPPCRASGSWARPPQWSKWRWLTTATSTSPGARPRSASWPVTDDAGESSTSKSSAVERIRSLLCSRSACIPVSNTAVPLGCSTRNAPTGIRISPDLARHHHRPRRR